MARVVDYSFSRPPLQTVKDHGYVGIARYLAPLPNRKVIRKPEVEEAHRLGLGVLLVWETTADRARAGAAAGRRDRAAAEAMAEDLGLPKTRPVFYAVDFDAQGAEILPYFQAIAEDATHPVGIYGGFKPVEAVAAARLASFFWQTKAWSRGRVSRHTQLLQLIGNTTIPQTDVNDILAPDWGGWFPGTPAPVPAPTPTEDDVLTLLAHITSLYVAIAGRYPDDAGLANWISQFQDAEKKGLLNVVAVERALVNALHTEAGKPLPRP